MLRVIGNDQNLPRQEHAIASGTLPNGKPVVVNTDGTVSVVAATSSSVGSTVTYNSGSTESKIGAAYDSNSNKVVIAYKDAANSNYGTAIVGTVSGTSISFGTEVVFLSSSNDEGGICFDSTNNKIVISTKDTGSGNDGKAFVGTVSGTSISFGSAVTYETNNPGRNGIAFDSVSGKVVVFYTEGSSPYEGRCRVGTVSGTSISFGSEVNLSSNRPNSLEAVFNSDGKLVFAFRDVTNSLGKVMVGTISGTSISFGSETSLGVNADPKTAVYDSSNDKVLILYEDYSSSSALTGVVATVSGTSVSVGSAVRINGTSSASDLYVSGASYNASSGTIVTAFRDRTASNQGTVVDITISGTSLTVGSKTVFETGDTRFINTAYDSTAEKTVINFRDVGDSENGKALVYTSSSQNLTSENYIGIARSGAASGAGAIIDTQGAIAEVDTEVTTTGFVISSGSYDSKSFSVASQETSPKGVFFKTDGTKMYVIGTAGGAVFQYGLSTAFDISTASYDSVTLTDFNVVGTNRNGADLFFHPDGTYVFIVETTNQTNLVRLTLSTPWDLSTAGSKVTNSSLPTNKASSNAQGIFFKPDGSKMYLCENRNAGTDVHGFDLSTNWDISSSSVSSDSSFETTAQDNEIGGLFLNTDGSEFYLIGYQNDKVYRYTISTPYDISTSTFADDFSVGYQETQPQAVTFKPDGTKMYVVGFTNDTVYQYSTSTSVGGPITAGQSYYVQTDGTLGTTAASPSVFAGTAVSATELIVKG